MTNLTLICFKDFWNTLNDCLVISALTISPSETFSLLVKPQKEYQKCLKNKFCRTFMAPTMTSTTPHSKSFHIIKAVFFFIHNSFVILSIFHTHFSNSSSSSPNFSLHHIHIVSSQRIKRKFIFILNCVFFLLISYFDKFLFYFHLYSFFFLREGSRAGLRAAKN